MSKKVYEVRGSKIVSNKRISKILTKEKGRANLQRLVGVNIARIPKEEKKVNLKKLNRREMVTLKQLIGREITTLETFNRREMATLETFIEIRNSNRDIAGTPKFYRKKRSVRGFLPMGNPALKRCQICGHYLIECTC